MTRDLAHVRRTDAAQTGQKASRLGELLAAGYAVPPGVVLTVAAVERYIEFNALADYVRAWTAASRDASTKELIAVEREAEAVCTSATLPPEIEGALLDWMRQKSIDRVVVRSSATNEDLAGATFAGQYDSYVNVDVDAVGSRVCLCIASLFSARAALYRRRKNISTPGAMAVLVQEFAPTDYAGVAFTHAPRRPDAVLVECAPGLGDAVVSGAIAPNRFLVSRSTLDVVTESAPHAIEHAVIARVARIALAIESFMQGPQDVEYGVVGDRLHIFQARPAL